jgi:ATP-dependent DNA helicase PIF1
MYENKNEQELIDKFRGLLDEYNETKKEDEHIKTIELSKDQTKAIELFNKGRNLFIIGEGGTGKSKLIKEMRYQTEKNWPNKKIVITATTGIAAYNINGITINSFMGIGTGQQKTEFLVKKIKRNIGIRERIKSTNILVIDEVSMASAELFEKINVICQIVRRSHLPFGGIQVVLTGDLLQLLPVFNKSNVIYGEQDQDTRLIFESEVFNSYFRKDNTIELTTNFRQSDPVFKSVLSRIRKGEQTEDDIKILRSRQLNELSKNKSTKTNSKIEPESMVHLVSSNKRAQIINSTNLNNLPDKGIIYKSLFAEEGEKEITQELKKELVSQFTQKGIQEIHLKLNARVMLIKNLDVEKGLVNGSVGTVIRFEEVQKQKQPVIKFDNLQEEILITPTEWQLEFNDSSVTAIQLPLMLCWAITIHKSQSLTLERALVELEDCFCEAQIYVALSRLKSLEGLYIKSFNPKKIMVNKKVLQFIKNTSI